MAIVISGVNNNDKITASDGTIDLLSGVNFTTEITAHSFKVGDDIQFGNAGIATAANFKTGVSNLHSLGLTLSGGQLDVGNHIKLGHAGIVTATTFVGNVTGNINNTTLLLQTGGTERARIDSGGRLLVGTTSNSNAVRAVFQGYQGGGDNFQARVQFQTNQATNLASGSHLANLLFTNASGSVGAQIDVKADAAWGTNDYPARIEFKTTADSANSPTERLRIKSNGIIVAGNSGTSFGNALIQSFIAHGSTGSESGFASIDTTSVAAGVGGEIAFHGKFNTGAQDYAYLGHIRGIKENATAGDTACALTFYTRPNATGPSERLRITSDGKVDVVGGYIGRDHSDSFTLNGVTQPHYGFQLNPSSTVPVAMSGYYGIAFATEGTERLRILRSGVIETYGGSGGAALRVKNGGDMEFYAANNSDKVTLHCDSNLHLTVGDKLRFANTSGGILRSNGNHALKPTGACIQTKRTYRGSKFTNSSGSYQVVHSHDFTVEQGNKIAMHLDCDMNADNASSSWQMMGLRIGSTFYSEKIIEHTSGMNMNASANGLTDAMSAGNHAVQFVTRNGGGQCSYNEANTATGIVLHTYEYVS